MGEIDPDVLFGVLNEGDTFDAAGAIKREIGPSPTRDVAQFVHLVGREVLRQRNVRVILERFGRLDRTPVEGLVHVHELIGPDANRYVNDIGNWKNLNIGQFDGKRLKTAGRSADVSPSLLRWRLEGPWGQ